MKLLPKVNCRYNRDLSVYAVVPPMLSTNIKTFVHTPKEEIKRVLDILFLGSLQRKIVVVSHFVAIFLLYRIATSKLIRKIFKIFLLFWTSTFKSAKKNAAVIQKKAPALSIEFEKTKENKLVDSKSLALEGILEDEPESRKEILRNFKARENVEIILASIDENEKKKAEKIMREEKVRDDFLQLIDLEDNDLGLKPELSPHEKILSELAAQQLEEKMKNDLQLIDLEDNDLGLKDELSPKEKSLSELAAQLLAEEETIRLLGVKLSQLAAEKALEEGAAITVAEAMARARTQAEVETVSAAAMKAVKEREETQKIQRQIMSPEDTLKQLKLQPIETVDGTKKVDPDLIDSLAETEIPKSSFTSDQFVAIFFGLVIVSPVFISLFNH
jgi:hypothetical protein